MAAPESGKGTSGRWTVLEHDMFVEGLRRFGRCWRSISQLVPTRSVVQIRTHAQKFFMKLEKTGQEIPTMDNRPGGQAPVDVADAARLVTEERSALDAGEQKPRLATLGPAVQAGGGGPSEADSAGRPRATAGRPRAGSSGGSGGSSAVRTSNRTPKRKRWATDGEGGAAGDERHSAAAAAYLQAASGSALPMHGASRAASPNDTSSTSTNSSHQVVASGSVGSAAVAAPGVVAAMSRSGSSPLSQAAVDMHHGMGGNGVPTGDAAGAYFAGDGPAASAAMAPGTRPTIAMVKAPAAGGNGRSSASVASPSASIGGASPMVSSVSGRSGGQATSGQRRKSSKAGGGGSSSKRRAHRASGQSGGAGGAGRGGSAGGAASAGGGAPGGQSGRGAASRGKHSSLDMTPRLQPSPEAELIDPDSDNDDAGHGGATFDGPHHHHHHHHHHHGRPHHGTASTVTLQQFSGAATSAGAAPPAVFARASSSATGDRVAMLQPVPAGAPVFSRASGGGGSGQRPRGKSEATIAFRQAPPLADFSHDEAFPFANDASSAAVQRRRAQSLATQGKHSKSVPLAPLALPGSGLGVTNVQMSPGGLLYGLARQHAAAQSVGGSPSLNFAQGDSSRGDQARGDDSDDDAASPAHPTAFRRGRFPPGLDVSTAESPALDGGHHMPLGRGRRGTVHRSRRASRARADEDEEEDESGLNHHHHHHHHGHHHHQHQQRHQLHHQPHQQHRFLPPASSIPLGDSASSARAAAAAAAFAHGGEVGLGGNAAKRVRMAGARDASAAAMSAVAAVAEARPPPVVAEPSALSWATAAADQARQHPPAVV